MSDKQHVTDTDTQEEITTLKADVAELKKSNAALAQQTAKLMALVATMATRSGLASPIDEQATLIAARAGERARQVTPPVKFGSATPYDPQVGRIDGKRKEALGK